MKFRQLGKSQIKVSELSLGCMTLPNDLTLARPIVEKALEANINYFDTADLYNKGENETMLGEILKPYRDDIYIATKVGNRFSPDRDDWTWDPSRKHIEKSIKDSLTRLKTDRIDLYQLHGGTIEDNFEEIVETFEHLKQQGYIREYGISSIRPNVFVPFSETNAVSTMMQYNMLDRCAEEYFTTLKEHGVSVLTRGTIAKGLLTDTFDERLKSYMNYTKDELERLLPAMQEFGSLHALALAYNLQHEAVASTVIGASSLQQLQQSLQAYKEMPITIPEKVNLLLKVDRYEAHR